MRLATMRRAAIKVAIIAQKACKNLPDTASILLHLRLLMN